MNYIKQILLILIITIFLTTTPLLAYETEPLFPWEDDIYGLRYSEAITPISPYLSLSYDFSEKKFFYQLGSEIILDEDFNLEFDYRSWPGNKLPNYSYQKGYHLSLVRKDHFSDLEESFRLSAFEGDIGQDLTDESAVRYLSLDYWEEIYQGYNSEAKIHLEALYGEDEVDDFYLTAINLPIRRNNFHFDSYLGYINSSSITKPSFQLKEYVKGYDEQGDSLVAIDLEQRFKLLRDSHFPLEGALFSQIGTTFDYADGLKRDDLKANLGGAIIAPLDDRFELRLNSYITKEEEWEPYDISINLKPLKF